MSSTEKKELRERLTSYMEYHPLPAALKTTKKAPSQQSSALITEAFRSVSVPFSLLFKSSAVAAALVLVVVPFLAEQSVPGDTLYAVKVQINEEVRSSLTFDSYEKVEWETQRVNRRIAEARLLESEGRLTQEVEAEVAQAVRIHTQNAQKEIAMIRSIDAEEATIASIAFDSNLEAQASSFKEDTLVMAVSSTSTPMMKLKSSNLIADAVDESRSQNEQPNASTTPSYAKLIARVEQNTTRMYELSDALESLNPDHKESVTRRILDVERSVEQAINLQQKDEMTAREILIDVLKRTQKMIVFMTDLEVSDTVDIEELVPVMLTSEEKTEAITNYKAQISEKQSQIQVALDTKEVASNVSLSDKVRSGLNQVTTLSNKIDETANYTEIRAYAVEAIEIADDLLLTLENTTKKPVAVPTPVIVPPAQSSSTASSSVATSTEQSPETDDATTTASTTPVDARS